METKWVTLKASDLARVIAVEVLGKSNENIDADSVANKLANAESRAAYDPTLDDRATQQISMAVAECRGAIQMGDKSALSLEVGAVPPECVVHVLYLAAYRLVNSSPNLQMVILSDKGAYSPLTDNFKSAQKYIELLSNGKPTVPPSEPTGRDYLTAINTPWFCNSPSPFPPYNPDLPINPPVAGVRFGGSTRADLSTFDSIFMSPAPLGWPSSIGQP